MTTSTTQQATIRAGLHALFATGIYNVTFIKGDGTLRTLKVTLNPELLPPAVVESTVRKPARVVNDANATVYDLDAKAWKSFTISELISLSQVFE